VEHRNVGADPSEASGIRGSELALELEVRTDTYVWTVDGRQTSRGGWQEHRLYCGSLAGHNCFIGASHIVVYTTSGRSRVRPTYSGAWGSSGRARVPCCTAPRSAIGIYTTYIRSSSSILCKPAYLRSYRVNTTFPLASSTTDSGE
jgi:hypothetical protein